MPKFLLSGPPEALFNSLAEAVDEMDIGIILLDRYMRVRFLNRRLCGMFDLPPAFLDTRPTFRDVLEHSAARSWYAIPAPDVAAYLDQREAAVRAGTIAQTHIDLRDGRRLLFGCSVCSDGGRALTYADVSAEPRPEALDALEQINAELRFNNETMEDHAAGLASLAEATDESARRLAEVNQALEREVVERGRLEARLREVAITDGLTGALNRVGFLARGQTELERALTAGEGLTMLMLDVDHFKSVNDRFGHAGGDAALRHLIAVVSKQLRRSDLMGRLGGEEFAVLLPAIAPADSERLARRLVMQVAKSPAAHGDRSINMTVSIGLALARPTDHSIEQVIARADDALYRAKAEGRNRMVKDYSAEAVSLTVNVEG